MQPRKAFRSGMLVFSANVTEILVNTVRNIMLARLLSIENFGIAATFTLLATMLDFVNQAGLARMAVQARDHDDPRLQATLHSFQAILGLIAGGVMLLIAWPYAALIAEPSLTWAYATLALIPAMRGFIHLDSHRLQRHGRFGPWAVRQIVPPILSVIVIYPAFLWLGDYRVALVSIFVQQITSVAATFLGAERPFRFGLDRAIGKRAWAFGAPTMLNALMIYFIINGDRLVVANQFGMAALGWFSAAVTLTLMPMNFVAKTVQTALLPTLARRQDDTAALQRSHDLMIAGTAAIAIGFTAGLALLGWLILRLTFGAKFEPAEPFLILLGFMQGMRLIRAAPALIALAKADAANPLYSNIVRGGFTIGSLFAAIATRDIHVMLWVGVAGEVAAAAAAIWLLRRKLGLHAGNAYLMLFGSVLLCGTICAVSLGGWPLLLLLPAAIPFLIALARLARHELRLLRASRQ